MTAHRGLERLKVSTMRLATTPSFFQQRMENIVRQFDFLSHVFGVRVASCTEFCQERLSFLLYVARYLL
jgi:hypothetical protein